MIILTAAALVLSIPFSASKKLLSAMEPFTFESLQSVCWVTVRWLSPWIVGLQASNRNFPTVDSCFERNALIYADRGQRDIVEAARHTAINQACVYTVPAVWCYS